MRTHLMIATALMFLLLHVPAMIVHAEEKQAQYADWKHSGSMFILTTPDGANLPEAASEEGFPLLVRLNKEFFAFAQAQAKGEDIRFQSSDGKALPFQIDEWDALKGTASVWVRIPVIKGNAHQEIKLFWGKPDAKSESNGAAVFSESNGYLSVWHMGETVKDELGTVISTDTGTSATPGVIGTARYFPGKKGIFCGDKIANYPSGASSHSTEAWFRAAHSNATLIGWGNEEGGRGSKVRMQLGSPPHVRIDSNFSNVTGTSTLLLSDWIHVVHTYDKNDAKIYINGKLDGSAKPTLNIKSPSRLWLGGWYNNYDFVGDLDEVRISKVARSANWVKMEYENQKAMHTMVGSLVQPGNSFSVLSTSVTLDEGKSATVTAQAGGAQKLFWILKKNGTDTLVAVDTLSFPLDAGRVTSDTSYVIQFKAVYANEIKTKDISVTIKEAIPEPIFTLKAPSGWNGRDAIEVLPAISNLAEMTAKGAGELHYQWSVSGGAVIQEIVPGKLILKRSQYTGPLTVKAVINNGGADSVVTAKIQVAEPKSDPWVQRMPSNDEKPEDGQFYARDDKNEGTLYYNGTLEKQADAVFLKVYADGALVKSESLKPGADKAYAFAIKLKPGLIKYKVEFGTKSGEIESVVQTVSNLVCGDAYLIEGQSNALATDTGEKSPPVTSEWIRSYGSPSGKADGARANLWCYPVWKAQKGEKAELGYWGMELAKRLLDSQKIPIFIINGAVGGTRIDQHQRSESNPADLTTIYGRMLWRIQQARLTHGIRGVLWHQGEADQGSDGPTGGYGWETYQQYFVDMSAGWKTDFPNVQHYYLFQIWPNACSQGGGHGDMLREVQRTLPGLYSNMDIMTTVGIKPPGGCHYPLAGWAEFARLMQPLIERDFYGKKPAASITPPNLKKVSYTSIKKDSITLEFDQPVVWTDSLTSQFYFDDAKEKVASGSVSGNVITLILKASSTAKKMSYLHEMGWSQDKLIFGANGIAALTFCEVTIEGSVP